jgi:hypothetical protein
VRDSSALSSVRKAPMWAHSNCNNDWSSEHKAADSHARNNASRGPC